MKNFTAVLFLFIGLNCFAQFSKTHYIPPLSNSNAQPPQGQFLYISSPSPTPVNFKIIALGGNIVRGTVSKAAPYTFNIGTGSNTQLMISRNNVSQIRDNKGYIVEAEDLVYVNVRLTTTPNHFQAGGIVSKGLAALGNQFRVGAFLNTPQETSENNYTFATVLATENNTLVEFEIKKPGVQLINNVIVGSGPPSVTLNRGESYSIAVEATIIPNRDGLIGMLIKSDKPIAVNCGSIAGTNGDLQNLDLGFDQIVSDKNIGKEYIFIKGNGVDITERPLIVAHYPNTNVFLNGSTVPFNSVPMQPGDYLALNGTNFSANGSLYVRTSEDVFAYQSIGGSSEQANQNMCFVPPLSCPTPKIIDNIPFINRVGSLTGFIATVGIVTKVGAVVQLGINNAVFDVPSNPLPAGVQMAGPTPVIGNPGYVTYTIKGLTGNISVFSTKQVYLSYFGSSGAATYGGFYSGFTVAPEIAFTNLGGSSSNCIPTIDLTVNSLTAYDDFQWYFNNNPIPGATSRNYTPLQLGQPNGFGPGLYYVKAKILECGIEETSDKIPVSSCSNDSDGDGVNDNVDIDLQNDGIANCDQSYGNVDVDWSISSSNKIEVASYSNPFAVAVSGTGTQSPVPFTGTSDGNFVSSTNFGVNNSVTATMNFNDPISLLFEYADAASTSNLLSANGDFTLRVPVHQTITVVNPDDQLLIDTNYDGIFESGVTEFSSFEIRFRLNGGIPLAAGTGTFQFRTRLVDWLTYTHRNLSDVDDNNASFKLLASCIPKDTDADGIADEIDVDGDNDGIPNAVETSGPNFGTIPFSDQNTDGMNDAFGAGLTLDTDGDGVLDYLDLDSDNDGIFDITESGSGLPDSDNNGRIDVLSVGINGLLDALETAPDSGILNYSIANNDSGDTVPDYIDLDSDNDGCFDVSEADFSDADLDGILGLSPVTVDPRGLVTSGTNGYTTLSNDNYITALLANPVVIQPECDRNPLDAVADYAFDTSNIDTLVLNGQTDIDITYFDAGGNPLPSPLPNPFITSSQTLKVRLTNNNTSSSTVPCFVETTLQFTVNIQPYIASPVTRVELCDDLPDNRDGISVFPTSLVETTLLGTQTGFTIQYFSQDGSEMQLPLTTNTQSITVLIENPLTGCSVSALVDFVVNPLPDVDEVNEDAIPLCLNQNQTVTMNAGLLSGFARDYNYEWSRNGAVVPGALYYNLTVKEDGIYTVKVTNKVTGCFRIRTNTVFYSEVAAIPDVVVMDLTNNNTADVKATGSGIYEYSLDNPQGPFQVSSFFENVAPGIHTVYVNDTNGCGTASKEIAIVGAPSFFTPNGDSFNDHWKIVGVNPVFYPKSIVYIFDRFGKLVKEITSGSDIGWDGTLNGQPLPGDDYWFVLHLQDGRVARGHFALKR